MKGTGKGEAQLATPREGEARFQALTENLPVGIYRNTVGPQGSFLEANPAIVRMFGYESREAFLRARVSDLYQNPEDRARFSEKMLRDGYVRGEVLTLRRKDGTGFVGSVTAEAITDETGKAVYYDGIIEDITERKRAEDALQHRIALENLITSISTQFINLSSDEIDAGIDNALQEVGVFTDVDRSYVFLFSDDGATMDNTHEWCREGTDHQIDALKGIPVDALPWFADRITRPEVVHVPSVATLDSDASVEQTHWQEQDIRSLIVVPIVSGGSPIGFVGFDSVWREKTWSDDTISLLRIVGEVFAGALKRKQMDGALRESEAVLRAQALRQEALLHISKAVQEMARPSDLEQVMQVCLDEMRQIGMNAQAMAINILKPEEAAADTYRVGPEGVVFFAARRYKGTQGQLTRYWRSGKTYYGEVGENVEDAEQFQEKFGGLPIRSYINVPFSLGVISAHSTYSNAFSDLDELALKQAGEIFSVGISRVVDLERVEAQTQALRESERLYRSAIEAAGAVPYYRNYRTNSFDFVGEGIQELTGLSREAFTPEAWHAIVQEEIPLRRSKRVRAQNAAYSTGGGRTGYWQADVRIRMPNGEERWLNNVAVGVPGSDGYSIGDMGILQDITERKWLEQELVRTQRLRAVGELSAGVSHNLNNILTGILGPAQMLEMMTDDPEVFRHTGVIIASALRARDLVHRLHLSTRGIEEGKLRSVQLNAIVREAVLASRPRWKDESEAKGIALEVVTDLDDVPPIRGTESSLLDIFVNLIFNAVDAMPEGGAIAICTKRDAEVVLVTVSDTGMGMDEETGRRIFEPFFTTKMDVGSGLGLSTAYGAVTRWGGSMDVESAPGAGATFTIRFPVWTEPELKNPIAEEAGYGRRGKVLVVEDDETVCSVLSSVLEGHHEVICVQDGPRALEVFALGAFDVALIDLGMPGMPGDRVLRAMRRGDAALASVLITGWELDEDDPRLSLFDFQIRKPFDHLGDVGRVVAQAIALHDERAGGVGDRGRETGDRERR